MAAGTVGISEVIDRRPIGGYQRTIVVLCALLAFVEGFDAQNAGFVAPAVAKAFHLGHNAMGLFFSLGLFGLMLGALIVAPVADRIGRKPVLLGCMVLFGLGSLGMAASTSVEMLYLTRFLTGLGIGGAMPNAIAMTSEYSPRRIRSLMVVMMFNGFIGGSIAAGLTAARIVEALGWNSVFIVGGVLPLALAPAILLLLPESVRFLASREGKQAKVAELMRRIDPSLPADARFVLDDHSTARMSVAALFRDGRARKTLLLWLLVFCSLLDLFLMTNWLPTQIASLGVSVAIAILISTCLQVGGMVGMVQGWMMDKWGSSRTLTVSYLIAAVSIACIAVVGSNVPLLTVSVLCAGFGVIGGQTAANAVAADAYPTEIRATGIGWFLGVGRVGSIVGPSLAGFLLSAGVSNRDVFLMATIPALCAAAAAFGLGPMPGPMATVERQAAA
ncbi:MAG TPA: MFS transporter [Caulobacteraceae bacterium]|jgi:AAHS family 4-hydroxybenzoate transporter-like MFS transporter|nr:MFS transporter [Caulobacteraceae bacterium]